MIDREGLIGNLQVLRTWCAVNPNYGMGLDADDCEKAVRWLDDALDLLKELEPIKPKKVNRYIDFDEDRWPYTPDTYDCGWCGEELPWMLDTAKRQTKHYKPNYCPECGRKVKWDD